MPVELGKAESVPVTVGGEPYALVPKSSAQPEYGVTLPKSLTAPVQEGERLGTLHVRLGGETAAELPLLAGQTVPRLGYGGILALLAGRLLGM